VYERLNFAIKSIKEAQACLSKLNLGQMRERLNNAESQAREAKRDKPTTAEIAVGAERSNRR